MKKGRRPPKRIKVPLLWLACSWLLTLALGLGLFALILRKSGVSFPIAAGQSTDPFFFAGLAAIFGPLLLQVLVLKAMKMMVMKRSAGEIARELGKDIAVMGAGAIVSAILDSGSSSESGKTSGSSETQGGGGSFGGGGASGGF